jgi:hypothetical protein
MATWLRSFGAEVDISPPARQQGYSLTAYKSANPSSPKNGILAHQVVLFQQRLQPLSGYCGLAKVDWSIK